MSDTLTVVGHPLILHKLTHMRRKDTSTEMFRRRLREIAQLLAYASLALVKPGGGAQALDLNDTTTCYKIVTTSYVAGLLGAVQSLTQNLLQVTAKDSGCLTPVDPTTRFVDADPTTAGVQQLKPWQALLKYVNNLPDANGDGVPDVPVAYAAAQGRIVVQP